MSFWSNLGKSVGTALDNNKQEVIKYMKQYRYYNDSRLEEIKNSRHHSLQQRTAANNLLDGQFLEYLD